MIKSMTGYGKGEALYLSGKFTVELKSVNNRYSEISVKMPRQFQSIEIAIKKKVAQVIKRGKTELYIQFEEHLTSENIPKINVEAAEQYFEAFSSLSEKLGISATPSIEYILSQKGVIEDKVLNDDEDSKIKSIFEALSAALQAIEKMRQKEGVELFKDISERLKKIEALAESVKNRSPEIIAEYRKKLDLRITSLLEGRDIDKERIEQEIAFMADKIDVTEECVRLASHFKQFSENLSKDEPVGRTLDFLLQEMNREVNTIGSKCCDAETAAMVIQAKGELEKIREQVQNIE